MSEPNTSPDPKSPEQMPTKHWKLILAVVLGLVALFGLTRVVLQHVAEPDPDRLLETKIIQSGPGKSTNLIIVVHGYEGSIDSMASVTEAIQAKRPDADLLLVEYPASTFSNADCFEISEKLCRRIKDVTKEHSYGNIEFVGYSMGALLARKAYVYGWGQIQDHSPPDDPIETRLPMEWVTNTSRFVLLAGMNRGWTTRIRPRGMSWKTRAIYTIGKLLGQTTDTGHLIRQCEAGEPFVANLRMQWLEVFRLTKGSNRPTVVQLLGDKDDIVSSEDNRDISVAKNFVWVQLSGTGHSDATSFANETYGPLRRKKFEQALGGQEELERLQRASPSQPEAEDTNVVSGVVVLHGIRDLGEWTSQFEDALQARFMTNAPKDKKLCIYRPTYGYFDMISFLRPRERQEKVRWFMDELTELQARYPYMTNLSFIGHSHGTYVLASALRKYKALRLNRAVFAGSVVRQKYPWFSPGITDRIQQVRNYQAADDYVVALLPRVFEVKPLTLLNDVGSAGFNGFKKPPDMPEDDWEKLMVQTNLVVGGHGAAIQTNAADIDAIAAFIVDGKVYPHGKETTQQAWLARWGSKAFFCVVIWLLMLAILGGVGRIVVPRIGDLLGRLTEAVARYQQRPTIGRTISWCVYILVIVSLLKLI